MSPDNEELPVTRYWPHAPLHRLSEAGTYFVTGATYQKQHFFRGAERLKHLQEVLLSVAAETGWTLEAWAVFSNHYHFVAHSPRKDDSASSLVNFIRHLHGRTAIWVNRKDDVQGRQVWHNYWDVKLTFESSYYARLSYTHQNAVKHGLVKTPSQYPWCSAAWFETTARPAQIRAVFKVKIDRIKVLDEFDVAPEW